jgi:hypothetical protein
VLLPEIYGWQMMDCIALPGALLMEDFSLRQAVVVNKADGYNLEQVIGINLNK